MVNLFLPAWCIQVMTGGFTVGNNSSWNSVNPVDLRRLLIFLRRLCGNYQYDISKSYIALVSTYNVLKALNIYILQIDRLLK